MFLACCHNALYSSLVQADTAVSHTTQDTLVESEFKVSRA